MNSPARSKQAARNWVETLCRSNSPGRSTTPWVTRSRPGPTPSTGLTTGCHQRVSMSVATARNSSAASWRLLRTTGFPARFSSGIPRRTTTFPCATSSAPRSSKGAAITPAAPTGNTSGACSTATRRHPSAACKPTRTPWPRSWARRTRMPTGLWRRSIASTRRRSTYATGCKANLPSALTPAIFRSWRFLATSPITAGSTAIAATRR